MANLKRNNLETSNDPPGLWHSDVLAMIRNDKVRMHVRTSTNGCIGERIIGISVFTINPTDPADLVAELSCESLKYDPREVASAVAAIGELP